MTLSAAEMTSLIGAIADMFYQSFVVLSNAIVIDDPRISLLDIGAGMVFLTILIEFYAWFREGH